MVRLLMNIYYQILVLYAKARYGSVWSVAADGV